MSVEQAKVSMSAGVTVEYAVVAGTVMIEAKSTSGELGVLELTTGQARELQSALLRVLGDPLGIRPPAPQAPAGRPDTSDRLPAPDPGRGSV